MDRSTRTTDSGGPTVYFVLEQTLGHITHSANLRTLIPEIGGVRSVFMPIEFDPGRRIPGWSNWTVRAGFRAARSITTLALAKPRTRPDAMFVHTQVPAVLLSPWMRRTPTVVSIDATPKQFDELGEFYAHGRGPGVVESVKERMNRRCFERANHLVTWSEWARQGLVTGYGIAPEQVTVIAPGVDVELWKHDNGRRREEGPMRILFVGNDLRRKGGHLLIEAFRRLRSDPDLSDIELHMVTAADVASSPGIVVHPGVTANSPELIAQYHAADVFCLPTLGDCLPMVLAEAAAAGLPLVSTNVGAIPEIVRPGVTGELVAPGDVVALESALRRHIADPYLRIRCGHEARDLAEREHDARKNASRLVGLMRHVSEQR